MDMSCHEFFEEKMLHELELLKTKYMQNPTQELSMQDIEKLDKIYHELKSQATYCAMKEAEDYGGESYTNNQNGNSEYRGRGMNGRYVSRDSADRYTEGYSRGYSEAMNQMNGNEGNSGHYPMTPYNMPRRW